MARVNKTTIKEIYNALDSSGFTLADFNIAFPDEGRDICQVVFAGDSKYWFVIAEDTLGVRSRKSPGSFRTVDDQREDGFGEAIKQIPVWCRLLKKELFNSMPIINEIRQGQEKLERDMAEHVKDPDAHLAPEQIAKITERFDAMLKEFEAMKEENRITAEQLQFLTADIDEMKMTASVYTKGNFVRTSVNKMNQWVRKFPGQEVLTQVVISSAKAMLGLPY